MFTKFTAESVQQARALAELLEKRAEKMEELSGIDAKLEEIGYDFGGNDTPTVTVGPAVARKPSQPRVASDTTNGGRRQPSLESVLLGLVEQSKTGLTLPEMVEKAIKSGYKSESQDFTNMVQQAVHRMMKKKVLTRDVTSMRYTKAAAA